MECALLVIYFLVVFAHKAIMYYQAIMKRSVFFEEFIDLLLKMGSFMQ